MVPALDCPVTVDGTLDEPCYRHAALVTDFVVASDPKRRPAATSAWLYWTRDCLVFAFDCDDLTLMALPQTANEHDVDRQDRVELFLWSGRNAGGYFCLEIAPSGAVHDYAARFYCVFRRHSDTDSDSIRTGFRSMSDSVPRVAGQGSGGIRTAIRDGPDSVPVRFGQRSGASGQFSAPP